jgi:hypothetical protein
MDPPCTDSACSRVIPFGNCRLLRCRSSCPILLYRDKPEVPLESSPRRRNPQPLGFRFHLPQLFPLLSTQRIQVGHTSKIRKAAFHEIANRLDAKPQTKSNSHEKRDHELDRPTIVHVD